MTTQRIGAMSLEDLKIDDGQERVYYDKAIEIEDGKQYKGEWYD